MARGGVTAIVHPAGKVGRFGVRAWGKDREVKGCIETPRFGEVEEDEDGAARTVSTGAAILMPVKAVVTEDDEVTVFGVRYEVDGPPTMLRKKSGRAVNLLVNLTISKGG